MSSTALEQHDDDNEDSTAVTGGEMSFLDHLEELRRRLTRSVLFIFIAFFLSWFVSGYVYNFLAMPVRRALADAQQRPLPLGGLTGSEQILRLNTLQEGQTGRYVFEQATKLGTSVIPLGASVGAQVARDFRGEIGVFTNEPIIAGATLIPAGVRLPVDLQASPQDLPGINDKLIVTTTMEAFSLYVKVALYCALSLSLPFLLWQIWGFVAPGLYPHERSYAVPFILLSSISFVLGAAFAYYIAFPPAARYLLGLASDFQLMLRASDYFDFIILIMFSMGLVFQMPAITYVLSRIGLVTAAFLARSWRIALIVIFVLAAVLSPTSDILNMMLFAGPMIVLYIVSIGVAWMFGKPRTEEAED